MPNNSALHAFLTFFTASVWVINGLLCKVLNLVPRHQLIVARILGSEHAAIITRAIGMGEILIAIWIISRIRPRYSTFVQIVLVATMNTVEFFMAPDLLLFGKVNAILAVAFIFIVYSNEFLLNKKPVRPSYDSISEK